MAAFSALTHANSPHIEAILEALARGSKGLSPEDSDFIVQFMDAVLAGTPAGEKWRKIIMTFVNYFPGRGTVMERAYLDGKAEGEAKGILRVLEVRGLAVSDEVRERISTCTDLDRLNDWLDRAGTVEHAEDLFDAAPEAPPSAPEHG